MTIIITDDDVKRLLPMADCIEAMRVAFRDFANGVAVNRPRMRYLAQHPDPERKYLANVHVGAVPSYGIACVRAGSQIIKPPSATVDRRLYENPKAFNWGIVILYSIETAEPLALMHEFQLSGMRVGATTGVAVDAIARQDATTLGLFGTGKQAHAALEAIACVRPIQRVNVYSPSVEHRAAFVRDMARDGIDVVAVTDAKAAVAGADIVCCATTVDEAGVRRRLAGRRTARRLDRQFRRHQQAIRSRPPHLRARHRGDRQRLGNRGRQRPDRAARSDQGRRDPSRIRCTNSAIS